MLNQTKFVGSSRGPRAWNRLLNEEQKELVHINDVKNSI